MIADIQIMVRKEIKELITQRQGMFGRGGWISLALIMILLGVLLPIEAKEDWVTNPIHIIWWVWLPFVLISNVVSDTFAGERERHTLETLLASRLPDKAILFGKIATVVGFAWSVTILGIIVSLITVNIAFGRAHLIIYTPMTFLAILLLSFLIALLSSGIGVFVSLRASTVRQSQQITGMISLIPILPMVVLDLLPDETTIGLVTRLNEMNGSTVVLILVGILLTLDLVIIAWTIRRFQRSKLILD